MDIGRVKVSLSLLSESHPSIEITKGLKENIKHQDSLQDKIYVDFADTRICTHISYLKVDVLSKTEIGFENFKFKIIKK